MADKVALEKEAILMREAFRSTLSILNRLEQNIQRAYKELVEHMGPTAADVLDRHVGCADWEDLEGEAGK